MKTNSDFHGIVLELVEKNEFEGLTENERSIILSQMTLSEFDQMRSVWKMDHQAGIPASPRKQQLKETLLEKFDEHQKPVGVATIRALTYFRNAAALFLFFMAGWFIHNVLGTNKPVGFQASITDTVYVTREVAVPIIYDTIYLEKAASEKLQGRGNNDVSFETGEYPVTSSDLPLQWFDSIPNRQKNNSVRDDSLLKKFAFITI